MPQFSVDSGFPVFSLRLDDLFTTYVLDVRKFELPVFDRRKTLSIFSDYGGEHKGSSHNTYNYSLGIGGGGSPAFLAAS